MPWRHACHDRLCIHSFSNQDSTRAMGGLLPPNSWRWEAVGPQLGAGASKEGAGARPTAASGLSGHVSFYLVR